MLYFKIEKFTFFNNYIWLTSNINFNYDSILG